MSAFEGKADMTVCGCLLSWSLLGVKRTCVAALHESAFDPKRTSDRPLTTVIWGATMRCERRGRQCGDVSLLVYWPPLSLGRWRHERNRLCAGSRSSMSG